MMRSALYTWNSLYIIVTVLRQICPCTYNFAKTPLKAAQAPLATAKNIHCDRKLQLLGDGISGDGCFCKGEEEEGGPASGF